MTSAERVGKMRAKNRKAGLCLHCCQPVEPGYVLCPGHRVYYARMRDTAKHRKYMRLWMGRKRAAAFVSEGGAA